VDLLVLLGRAALVFGLLALTLWLVRRTDGGRRMQRAAGPLEVVSSTRLGKGASLALVRIGTTTYALGVTEHAVSLLTETDLDPAPAPVPAPPAQPGTATRPGFAAALQEQTALLLRRGGAAAPATAPEQTGTATAGTATAGTPAAGTPPTSTPPTSRSTTADGSAAGTDTAGTAPAAASAPVRTDAPTDPVQEPPCPPTRPHRRPPVARRGRVGS